MKRKLMLLLGLLVMVVPFSACGEDENPEVVPEGQVRVSTNLTKLSDGGADTNYRVSDCAVVSGDGNYDVGSSVTITVEYNSNVCAVEAFELNNDNQRHQDYLTSGSDNARRIAKYTIHSIQETTSVNVIMRKSVQASSNMKIYLDGITKTSIENGLPTTKKLSASEYKFPYLKDKGTIAINFNPSTDENGYVFGSNDEVIFSKIVASLQDANNTKEVNLNYLYLKENENFVFKPYKLTWTMGKRINNTCNYEEDYRSIIDPLSTILPHGEELCIIANVDLTGSVDNSLKNIAIENMLFSEMFISTTSDNICLTSTNTNYDPSINEYCMYVARLKNLYDSSKSDGQIIPSSTLYYALNDSGNLEAVSTMQNGNKYFVCTNIQACSQNTYQIDYNSNTDEIGINQSYKMLAISDFIDSLGTGRDDGNTIFSLSTSNITFDYSHFIQDIVPKSIKINDDLTYYLSYVGDAKSKEKNPSYSPDTTKEGVLTLSLNSSISSYKYEVTYQNYAGDSAEINTQVNTAFEKVMSTIKNDTSKLIFSQSADVKSILRQSLYKIINSNSEYDILKNYKYLLTIEDKNIDIVIQNANISQEVLDLPIINVNPDKESTLCHKDNLNCIPEENRFLKDYINKLSNLSTSGLTIVDIDTNGVIVVYKFMISDNLVEISYDSGSKTFTSGETTIRFEDNYVQQEMNLTSITSKQNTIFGEVEQTLEVAADATLSIESKIGGSTPTGLVPDVSEITSLYQVLTNSDSIFYKIVGVNNKVICLLGTTTYTFEKEENLYVVEYASSREKQVIKYTMKVTFANITTPEPDPAA